MGIIDENPSPPGAAGPDSARRGWFNRSGTLRLSGRLVWLLLPLLLWWSLKDVPYQAVLQSLQQFQAWQMAALLGLNLVIILLISSRWWLILRSAGQHVPFLRLSAYRLIGFALSYFTPGPQVGGEPLQVLLLTRRHRVSTPAAISSVFMDKMLELFSNFAFLVLGLLVISTAGLEAGWVPVWVLPLIILILLAMTAHLMLFWQGITPFTWLACRLAQKAPQLPLVQSIYLIILQAETEMMTLCRTRPQFLIETMGVSLLIWAGLLWEYMLMMQFMGLVLNLPQVILALTLARLAFLVPLPGGLGALEASQVLAMQLLGLSPALGISLCLIIRARDLILGAAGLGMWGWTSRS
jgi:uncharacterized protein (TIRG00374 family)